MTKEIELLFYYYYYYYYNTLRLFFFLFISFPLRIKLCASF